MNKNTSTFRKGGIYELLGSETMVYISVQITAMACHPKPWKQADQILLLGILHIENEILEGSWETRAN